MNKTHTRAQKPDNYPIFITFEKKAKPMNIFTMRNRIGIFSISTIIMLVVISSCQSISLHFRNKTNIEDKQLEYKIISIDSLNLDFVYFITLLYKNNKDTIELISQKKECPNIYNQIKVNEKYKLSLYRVGQFPIKVLADGDTAYRRVADCNYDHNKPRFVNNLYSTSNLCGLNYLVDSTKIKHK